MALNKPVIVDLAILIALKNEGKGLTDKDGNPVWMNYNKLDWKKLSESLSNKTSDRLPEGISFYVWNDAQDVLDMMGDTESLEAWNQRMLNASNQVDWSNYRGGICDVSGASQAMHTQEDRDLTDRPPIAALGVSVKFKTFTQFADYHYTLMQTLFGEEATGLDGMNGTLTHRGPKLLDLPSSISEWLKESFEVDGYADKCGVYRLMTKRPA